MTTPKKKDYSHAKEQQTASPTRYRDHQPPCPGKAKTHERCSAVRQQLSVEEKHALHDLEMNSISIIKINAVESLCSAGQENLGESDNGGWGPGNGTRGCRGLVMEAGSRAAPNNFSIHCARSM